MRYILFLILISACFAQDVVFQPIKYNVSERRSITQSFGFQLTLDIFANGRKRGNQRTGFRQLATKDEIILAVGEQYATKTKTIYRNAQATVGPNQRMQRLPISGKEYLIEAKDDKLNITYKNGKAPYLPQEIEMVGHEYRFLGKENDFSKFFAGNTFKIGQESELPEGAVKALLGKEIQVEYMKCTAKEIRVVNAKQCAVFDTVVKMSVPMEQLLLTSELKGEMAISLVNSEVVSIMFTGVLAVDKDIETPQGVAKITGKGTIGFSATTSYSGIQGCIDSVKYGENTHLKFAETKILRLMKDRESKLVPQEAYTDVVLQNSDSDNEQVRILVAGLLHAVKFKPQVMEVLIKCLKEDGPVMHAAVYSCSRNRKLLTPEVKTILKEIYDAEQKKSNANRSLLQTLKRYIK